MATEHCGLYSDTSYGSQKVPGIYPSGTFDNAHALMETTSMLCYLCGASVKIGAITLCLGAPVTLHPPYCIPPSHTATKSSHNYQVVLDTGIKQCIVLDVIAPNLEDAGDVEKRLTQT